MTCCAMMWTLLGFLTPEEDCQEMFPLSEVVSPSHSTSETPVVPDITAQVSRPEHNGTCPAVLDSFDQPTLPSFLAADPGLFLAGANSAMFPSGAARILQSSEMRPEIPPPSATMIQPVERVSLPDVNLYFLSATWAKDPHFKITKEVATQTSEDVSLETSPSSILCGERNSVYYQTNIYI